MNEQMEILTQQVAQIHRDLLDIRITDLPSIQVEIAKLKVKAGIWGATSGVLAVIAAVLIRAI